MSDSEYQEFVRKMNQGHRWNLDQEQVDVYADVLETSPQRKPTQWELFLLHYHQCYSCVQEINHIYQWNLNRGQIKTYADMLKTHVNVNRDEQTKIVRYYHQCHEYVLALSNEQHPNHAAYHQKIRHFCSVIVRKYHYHWDSDRSLEDDDLVQLVMLKVWRKIHTFQYNSHLMTWLTTLIVNEGLQYHRQKSHKHTKPLDEQQLDPGLSLEAHVEAQVFIDECLAFLSKQTDQRLAEIFRMYMEDEPKLREIGKRVGVGITRAHTLSTMLREILSEYLDEGSYTNV